MRVLARRAMIMRGLTDLSSIKITFRGASYSIRQECRYVYLCDPGTLQPYNMALTRSNNSTLHKTVEDWVKR